MGMTKESWIKRKLNGKGVAWNKGLVMRRGKEDPRWSRISKNCKKCNKEFTVKNHRKDTAFFCSFACARASQFTSISPMSYRIRRWQIAADWRVAVFKRDCYTCQHCGIKNGNGKSVVLNVDHIKPFALIVRENNLQTLSDFMGCEELWDIKNGRTLCVPCHKKTPTFGRSSIYRIRQTAQA